MSFPALNPSLARVQTEDADKETEKALLFGEAVVAVVVVGGKRLAEDGAGVTSSISKTSFDAFLETSPSSRFCGQEG